MDLAAVLDHYAFYCKSLKGKFWKEARPCHSSIWHFLPGGCRSARKVGIPLLANIASGHVWANCPRPLCRAEGQLWHCLAVSSRQAAETNLTLITAAACPCPWGLVRSSLVAPNLDRGEVQGQAQPCCHLSVPLGQGKPIQNCLYSLALPLSTAALGAYRFWIALALDCCSFPQAPERQRFRTENSSGCA